MNVEHDGPFKNHDCFPIWMIHLEMEQTSRSGPKHGERKPLKSVASVDKGKEGDCATGRDTATANDDANVTDTTNNGVQIANLALCQQWCTCQVSLS